jgi:CRP-like cAMP-binding protein
MNFDLSTKYLSFGKGVFLEEECDTTHAILYLESGLINVSIALPNGKWTRIRQVKPNEFFSLSSFMAPNENLIFETLSDVKVHLIDKDVFLNYIANDPTFLEYYMSSMHQRVHFLLEKVVLFSIQNNRQRLLYFFINEVRKQNTSTIVLDMNKTCVLECLGMSRGSFYRELNTLIQKKCIVLKPDNTYICNIDRLHKLFENCI